MERKSYYASLLPVLDTLHSSGVVFFSDGAFIYGPSIDEVRSWMPRFSESMDSESRSPSRFIVIAAEEPHSAAELLDLHAEWEERGKSTSFELGYGTQQDTFWLPRPDLDLNRDRIPVFDEQDELAKVVLPLGLFLARAMHGAGTCACCAVPDAALRRPEVIAFLRTEMLDLLPPGFERDPTELVSAYHKLCGRAGQASTFAGRMTTYKTPNPFPGFKHWPGLDQALRLPEFSWKLAMDPAARRSWGETTILHLSGRRDPTYYSVLPRNWEDQADTDSARTELVDRLLGKADRTEDDSYPWWPVVVRTGHWSPSLDTSVETQFLPHLGVPSLRLADIASTIGTGDETSDESADDRSVFLALTGTTRMFTAWTPEFRVRRSGADGKDEPIEGPRCVLRCEDPEFLALVLASPAVQQVLNERAGGPWRTPRLTLAAVRHTRIPWPPPQTRERWRTNIRQHRKDLEALAEAAEEVYNDASMRADWIESGSASDLVLCRDDDFDMKLQIVAVPLLPFVRDRGFFQRSAPPEVIAGSPFPLAILRRRFESASSTHKRLGIVNDIADLVSRLDAAVCLSLAETLNETGAHHVLRKVSAYQPGAYMGWSRGHWVGIGTGIRKELSAVVENSVGRQMLGAINARCRSSATAALQELVGLRNKHLGHGFTLPERQASRLVEDFEQGLRDSEDRWGYLDGQLWFCPRAYRNTRDGQTMERVLLNGDNLEFAPETLPIDGESSLAALNEGEVYAMIARTPVCLWPWVILASGQTDGRELLWLIDGFNEKNGAVYKTTESVEILNRPREGQRIAELLGL